ncbi:MAG TPA: hypothetical protein O0X14_02450, partial [Methanocorpusculum sp.]|nr:hypothetical protein [Methanocorpusculum sp.]
MYSDSQSKIIKYLMDGVSNGYKFFKSKYIAKDLGLSSKEVGTNLSILAENCNELDIRPWSYSN